MLVISEMHVKRDQILAISVPGMCNERHREQNIYFAAFFFYFHQRKKITILHAVHGQASIYQTFFCHFCFLARWLQN